jgi:meiosis arrest female protein 1
MRLRNQSFTTRSQENPTDFHSSGSSLQEKPSFSSLFSSALNLNDGKSNNNAQAPDMVPLNSFSESLMDGDGVYLQISNLDQYYDEANLRHYLMNQLKPITPILSLTIETPSIAKIKVPSVQVRRKKIPINCYDYYNFNFYSSPSK